MTAQLDCAPFCGYGCTKSEHQKADRQAAKLVQQIEATRGAGWVPRVWENLGWHYSAVSPCGRLKVHPSSSGGFTAFLGKDDMPGGLWAVHRETPELAIAAVIAEAVQERDLLQKILDALL